MRSHALLGRTSQRNAVPTQLWKKNDRIVGQVLPKPARRQGRMHSVNTRPDRKRLRFGEGKPSTDMSVCSFGEANKKQVLQDVLYREPLWPLYRNSYTANGKQGIRKVPVGV